MPGFELIDEQEAASVNEVFRNGGILYRYGFNDQRNNTFKVKEFEDLFKSRLNSSNALAVSSGTAALRVALAALGIKEGDEVIFPSFTFVATAEAIIESGATPVAVNVDSTLNLDPKSIEKAITKKTKAIIAVHMLGIPCDIVTVQRICRERNLFLVEDTAWGLGASVNDRALGTFGDIGTFSFDYAKTITTGEGGMCISSSCELYERMSAWHDHGHQNNPNYPRWEDTRISSGFNFRMTELQGAIGMTQLRKLDSIVSKQREIASMLEKKLSTMPKVKIRSEPKDAFSTYDSFTFLVPDSETANECRRQLNRTGLSTKILPEAFTWHYAPTWTHMTSLRWSGYPDKTYFDESYSFLGRAVSLPISLMYDYTYAERVYQCLSPLLS